MSNRVIAKIDISCEAYKKLARPIERTIYQSFFLLHNSISKGAENFDLFFEFNIEFTTSL